MGDAWSLARALIVPERCSCGSAAIATLVRFDVGALRFALDGGTRIAPLFRCERYGDASAALRRFGVDVDAWPAAPAGLFVVEERTAYLRSRSAVTAAHEFGHALDCALGGGVYRSGIDPQLRRLSAEARSFVTPYAAIGIDEYFAVMWNSIGCRTRIGRSTFHMISEQLR